MPEGPFCQIRAQMIKQHNGIICICEKNNYKSKFLNKGFKTLICTECNIYAMLKGRETIIQPMIPYFEDYKIQNKMHLMGQLILSWSLFNLQQVGLGWACVFA